MIFPILDLTNLKVPWKQGNHLNPKRTIVPTGDLLEIQAGSQNVNFHYIFEKKFDV
jgi:hypothetical protein